MSRIHTLVILGLVASLLAACSSIPGFSLTTKQGTISYEPPVGVVSEHGTRVNSNKK